MTKPPFLGVFAPVPRLRLFLGRAEDRHEVQVAKLSRREAVVSFSAGERRMIRAVAGAMTHREFRVPSS